MTLAAGRLRHRVRLERPVQTQDPQTGDVVTTWQLVREVWVAIEPLSVREFIQASATQSAIAGRIVARAAPDLSPTWRVVHKGQVMNPAGWLPDKESGIEYVTAPYTLGDNLRE